MVSDCAEGAQEAAQEGLPSNEGAVATQEAIPSREAVEHRNCSQHDFSDLCMTALFWLFCLSTMNTIAVDGRSSSWKP